MLIRNPEQASHYLRRVMQFEQEEFWVLCLTSGLRLISAKLLFIGTVDRCLVHPRDVFRYALIHNSSRIMVAHCHPTGDSIPSKEDLEITSRLQQAGELLGIALIDHLVLSRTNHSSCLMQKGS